MKKIESIQDYEAEYRKSIENPEAFWAEIADDFKWRKKWSKILEWDFKKPEIKWFLGAKLNVTENCLDRHLPARANDAAIIWEPNNPKDPAQTITYQQLLDEVCRTANMLKAQGVKKGDRVCIYLPMIPQLAYTILACARIGAVHSVVFAGFSARSLVDRITDAGSKIVVTADGGFRGEKTINLKGIIDDALTKCPDVDRVIVYEHTRTNAPMKAGRDLWWHDEIKNASTWCEAEEMDSEDLLFILYTSGSTGKPKGMVHTCDGFMVYTNYTFRTVFQYEPGQVFWCTADIGWITGHSYILYGPFYAGATTVIFEGVPS